jgi:interferon gamma-inducible protein 30
LINAVKAQGLLDICTINLWPYGNAKENPDKSFTCQHGAPECKGNMNEACGIYGAAGNVTTKWWPYVLCLESGSPPNDAQKCATSSGLGWDAVNKCLQDKALSYQIMHGIAQKTDSLSPRKQYVPWVILNGKPLYQSFSNIKQKICAAYTGTKPPGCNSLDEEENAVCYPDEANPLISA